MSRPHPLILKAIKLAGSQERLEAITGIKQQTISRILNRVTPVQAEHAAKIEIATNGQVSRRELRPDLFFPEIKPSSPNTHPQPSLSAQDDGETGERPEKGSAASASEGSGPADIAQADQVVATAGRDKRRTLRAALPASDAHVQVRT